MTTAIKAADNYNMPASTPCYYLYSFISDNIFHLLRIRAPAEITLGEGGWMALGQQLKIVGDPDATSPAPGKIDVFATGVHGKLYHRWYPVPLPPEEPPPPPPEICLNNEDDNGDGTVDEEPCQTPPPVGEPEICGNRIDDDLDGMVDESPPCKLGPEEP